MDSPSQVLGAANFAPGCDVLAMTSRGGLALPRPRVWGAPVWGALGGARVAEHERGSGCRRARFGTTARRRRGWRDSDDGGAASKPSCDPAVVVSLARFEGGWRCAIEGSSRVEPFAGSCTALLAIRSRRWSSGRRLEGYTGRGAAWVEKVCCARVEIALCVVALYGALDSPRSHGLSPPKPRMSQPDSAQPRISQPDSASPGEFQLTASWSAFARLARAIGS